MSAKKKTSARFYTRDRRLGEDNNLVEVTGDMAVDSANTTPKVDLVTVPATAVADVRAAHKEFDQAAAMEYIAQKLEEKYAMRFNREYISLSSTGASVNFYPMRGLEFEL